MPPIRNQRAAPSHRVSASASPPSFAGTPPGSNSPTPHTRSKPLRLRRPPNAFFIFRSYLIKFLKLDQIMRDQCKISTTVGPVWHSLTEAQQSVFYEMANQKSIEYYELSNPGYIAHGAAAPKARRKRKRVKAESALNEDVLVGSTVERLQLESPSETSSPASWSGCDSPFPEQSTPSQYSPAYDSPASSLSVASTPPPPSPTVPQCDLPRESRLPTPTAFPNPCAWLKSWKPVGICNEPLTEAQLIDLMQHFNS